MLAKFIAKVAFIFATILFVASSIYAQPTPSQTSCSDKDKTEFLLLVAPKMLAATEYYSGPDDLFDFFDWRDNVWEDIPICDEIVAVVNGFITVYTDIVIVSLILDPPDAFNFSLGNRLANRLESNFAIVADLVAGLAPSENIDDNSETEVQP